MILSKWLGYFRGYLHWRCANYALSDCDAYEVKRLSLRNLDSYNDGAKRVGHMTVEDRLILYILTYCLIPRPTSNHAHPNEEDLTYMFAIKNCIKVNWPKLICQKMLAASKSRPSHLLPYPLLVSRLIEHNDVTISPYEETIEFWAADYCMGDRILHFARIYCHSHTVTWMWQSDIAALNAKDWACDAAHKVAQDHDVVAPDVPVEEHHEGVDLEPRVVDFQSFPYSTYDVGGSSVPPRNSYDFAAMEQCNMAHVDSRFEAKSLL
ncbi:hypothetical protein RIF29_25964 [Crotalaria pallida]|uniref:Uncharacterized protein n=1 Tax=Crotalaria pallida TaxID=3830 RepID=A0AAN9I4K2_CROPI